MTNQGVYEFLQNLILELTDYVQQRVHEKQSRLNHDLFQYINQHFTSHDLSLQLLSSKFSLSVSYISRFIKERSGKNFTKYIQDLRFTKIKNELANTSLPIKTIVEQNGYYDLSNFSRKFKLVTGITPSQYRARSHDAQ